MDSVPVNIEKSFIEKQLGISLKSILVEKGSKPGDNYMSNIFAIKAYTHESEDPMHLFLKVFPQHLERQKTLKLFNLFVKELDAYENIVPSLVKYQKGPNIVRPKFAKFLTGDAVNYKEVSNRERLPGFYDNFIMMEDIRKSQGYLMVDRHKGADFQHASLVVTELAKLHALSWGLRVNRNFESISEMFPLTSEGGFSRDLLAEFEDLLYHNYRTMMKMVGEKHGVDSEIYKGAARIGETDISGIIIDYLNPPKGKLDHFELSKMYRTSSSTQEELKRFTDVPWNVICHGDCWINNMLFKYEGTTPVDICLVDLQILRDGCPTTDLAYFLHTSIFPKVLKVHEDELLHIYYDAFINVCDTIGVEPLPDFTFDNLKKRFNNTKLIGLILCAAFVPIMHAEPTVDLDDSAEGVSSQEMMINLSNSRSEILNQRILECTEAAFAEGII